MSKTVKVSISIDKDIKHSLEEIAQELDITMSKFARNLIYLALDDFKDLEKIKLGKKMLASNLTNFKATIDYYAKSYGDDEIDSLEFDLVQISVVMDAEVKEILEKMAKEMCMPFKLLTANMLYVGLRSVKLVRKTGVLRLAYGFQKNIEAIKSFINK